MKSLLRTLILTSAALLPQSAFGNEFTASIVAGHPPVFRWVKVLDDVFIPAVDRLLEGSDYSVSFAGQYGGALAGVGQELEAVQAGLAEIGTCFSLFDPSKMGVQNVTYYTPFVSSDARLISEVMNELQTTNAQMQASYADNDVVYVGAPFVIDDYLLMSTLPVTTLKDLNGRKIGAPGAALNWLSGTGAVGVSSDLTTHYNSLKTGVFDGVLVFATAALTSRLVEVAPHITKIGLGSQYAGALCANSDWWNGLPPEVQKAMTDAANLTGQKYLEDLEAAVETAIQEMSRNGGLIVEPSDDLRASWVNGMENAAILWAESIGAKEVLADYMDGMRAGGAVPLRDWDQE